MTDITAPLLPLIREGVGAANTLRGSTRSGQVTEVEPRQTGVQLTIRSVAAGGRSYTITTDSLLDWRVGDTLTYIIPNGDIRRGVRIVSAPPIRSMM